MVDSYKILWTLSSMGAAKFDFKVNSWILARSSWLCKIDDQLYYFVRRITRRQYRHLAIFWERKSLRWRSWYSTTYKVGSDGPNSSPTRTPYERQVGLLLLDPRNLNSRGSYRVRVGTRVGLELGQSDRTFRVHPEVHTESELGPVLDWK